MKFVLLILLIAFVQLQISVAAQGLVGPVEKYRGGTTAGGVLIPGKTDQERWKLLQANQRALLGKTEKQVIAIFGKGGNGFKLNQKLYLITDYKRKNGKPFGSATELEITYLEGKVESYTVCLSHWGG